MTNLIENPQYFEGAVVANGTESMQFTIDLMVKEIKSLRRTVEQQRQTIESQRDTLLSRGKQIKQLGKDLAYSQVREKLSGAKCEEPIYGSKLDYARRQKCDEPLGHEGPHSAKINRDADPSDELCDEIVLEGATYRCQRKRGHFRPHFVADPM